MSERRKIRLLLLALVLAGAAGTAATLAGWMAGTDGTLAFPASVVIGIMGLHANRPQKRTEPPSES